MYFTKKMFSQLNIFLVVGVIKTSAYCVSRRIVFETFMLSFQFVPISRRTLWRHIKQFSSQITR